MVSHDPREDRPRNVRVKTVEVRNRGDVDAVDCPAEANLSSISLVGVDWQPERPTLFEDIAAGAYADA